MNTFAKLALTSAAIVVAATVYAKPVFADSIDQDNNVNINCSTGSYGQNTTCYSINNQNASITSNRNFYHKPVDSGMSPATTAVVVTTLVTTLGGDFITLKTKFS